MALLKTLPIAFVACLVGSALADPVAPPEAGFMHDTMSRVQAALTKMANFAVKPDSGLRQLQAAQVPGQMCSYSESESKCTLSNSWLKQQISTIPSNSPATAAAARFEKCLAFASSECTQHSADCKWNYEENFCYPQLTSEEAMVIAGGAMRDLSSCGWFADMLPLYTCTQRPVSNCTVDPHCVIKTRLQPTNEGESCSKGEQCSTSDAAVRSVMMLRMDTFMQAASTCGSLPENNGVCDANQLCVWNTTSSMCEMDAFKVAVASIPDKCPLKTFMTNTASCETKPEEKCSEPACQWDASLVCSKDGSATETGMCIASTKTLFGQAKSHDAGLEMLLKFSKAFQTCRSRDDCQGRRMLADSIYP